MAVDEVGAEVGSVTVAGHTGRAFAVGEVVGTMGATMVGNRGLPGVVSSPRK